MNSQWGYFPPSKPRQVQGGLKAKSARGKIATTWWSTRFIDLLEQMGMGSRLTRGRNYARRGQVLSLALAPGLVTASVQGSRVKPYRVRIGVTAYGKAEWARVEERLSADAWFVAQLLAGEMPLEIEQVFAELGLDLFPRRFDDLMLDCSCPDWEVPCKHLAAAFYLLAERLDTDPFELLAWRGREREDLLAHLHSNANAEDPRDLELPTVPADFYGTFHAAPHPGGSGAGILDQLPEPGLTIRRQRLVDVLRPAYSRLHREDDLGPMG